jgi:hypothetical protein
MLMLETCGKTETSIMHILVQKVESAQWPFNSSL